MRADAANIEPFEPGATFKMNLAIADIDDLDISHWLSWHKGQHVMLAELPSSVTLR